MAVPYFTISKKSCDIFCLLVKSTHGVAAEPRWEPSLVLTPAARFENLIALHLLKLCHFLNDREGFDVQVHYLRDRAGREVDFLVVLEGKRDFVQNDIRCVPARQFLGALV